MVRIKIDRLLLTLSAVALAACLLLSGCGGDKGLKVEPAAESVQGVWEGSLSLSTGGDTTHQRSSLRLEFVQRDFMFDGLVLRTDPLAGSFGAARVDTFLVSGGSVSTTFVSFSTRALDGSGTPAVFEGQLDGESLGGTVVGGVFSGQWQVRFLY
ncbi:hypothetical protein LLH00_17695 [bacterium]|nr:hypothetical protein [bacterium]